MTVRLAHALLRERRLNGESVYFDGYSGETHYLDGLAGAVMRRVFQSGGVDLALLHTEFGNSPEHDHGVPITSRTVDDTIATLQRLGLIRIDDER